MARYPGATWKPVDRYQRAPLKVAMNPRRVCAHTAVSNATPSMHSFFNTDGRATPHFYLGKNGELEQYIDTDFRASANLDGNWNIISIESWDGFGDSWKGGGDGPRWTDKQVDSLALLFVWIHKHHNIPLRALRNSLPTGAGFGWHRLGIDGDFLAVWPLRGRIAGGEHWSSSFGKTCPTNTRIKQVVNEVLPHARQIASGKDNPKMPKRTEAQKAAAHLRKSIQDMKPGPRRHRLRRALEILRGVIGPRKANRHPQETERRISQDRN